MEKDFKQNLKIRYYRLWIFSIVLMCAVALIPLIIISYFDYYQYEDAYNTEVTYQVSRRISYTKHTLETFIGDRLATLNLLISEEPYAELSDSKQCTKLLSNLKKSFNGFIDIGLIDSDGNHRSYTGPYDLAGKNYKDQHWFHEVNLRGVYVSDVFMGFRKFPHFVIAIKHELPNGDFYILRSTLSTTVLDDQIHSLEIRPKSDAFLINSEGVLQTPSKFYGQILERCHIEVPPYAKNAVVKREDDSNGDKNIFGYAYIEKSPFILIVSKGSEDFMGNLKKVRTNLNWFLGISIILIISIVLLSTAFVVKRVSKSDTKQAKILHDMEYTSKMASLGRLAAGVAHEINNPLAIINEKAGLLKDYATLKPDFVYKEKILQGVDSILKSVERCSVITHRLLSFAKRMDVNSEVIDLELLLKEVMGFLEREAIYRGIEINYHIAADLPSIESDRGQIQQVFLNIITNAFYAVQDKGQIEIYANRKDSQYVKVTVADNGVGISKENLKHIFEPFFTTKGKYGTGLGLSITYGIVEKLGGEITVDSTLGRGTSFTVTLPIKSNIS
jgi:two-component system NtrC family sensor kinase